MTATEGTDRRHAAVCAKRAILTLGTALAVLGFGAVLLVLPGAHVYALKAAGAFSGDAIGGVQQYVEKLKGNVIWAGGTAMGLVIAVVGILFLVGHKDAHTIAIRTLLGLAVLASVSGIAA